MMGLREHWAAVTQLLSEALSAERDRLGAEQAAIVLEYLDHNELELAHDHILDALGDCDLRPLPQSEILLSQAARRMGLKLE